MIETDPCKETPNRLLASLGQTDYRRIASHLEDVTLEHSQVMHEPRQRLAYVYFPCGALVSLMMVMEDGRRVETAVVGNDGMVGTPLILGATQMHDLAICQIAGPAKRLSARVLKSEIERCDLLRQLVNRHMQALLIHVARSVACNRLHSTQQRCARWLLTAHDGVGRQSFSLTQDFLAMMLGVRRASVTVAAGALQKAGLIQYHLGNVSVLDPEGLKKVACACYQYVWGESNRLAGA